MLDTQLAALVAAQEGVTQMRVYGLFKAVRLAEKLCSHGDCDAMVKAALDAAYDYCRAMAEDARSRRGDGDVATAWRAVGPHDADRRAAAKAASALRQAQALGEPAPAKSSLAERELAALVAEWTATGKGVYWPEYLAACRAVALVHGFSPDGAERTLDALTRDESWPRWDGTK